MIKIGINDRVLDATIAKSSCILPNGSHFWLWFLVSKLIKWPDEKIFAFIFSTFNRASLLYIVYPVLCCLYDRWSTIVLYYANFIFFKVHQKQPLRKQPQRKKQHRKQPQSKQPQRKQQQWKQPHWKQLYWAKTQIALKTVQQCNKQYKLLPQCLEQ